MAKQSEAMNNHPWDRAAASLLTRLDDRFGRQEPLDPGVNFFVLALEALGAKTRFSCEGHPTGFYVAFKAPYELALEIKSAGFFSVEIEGPGYWSLRKTSTEYGQKRYTEAMKVDTLRWAADAWLRVFGQRIANVQCLEQPARVKNTLDARHARAFLVLPAT